MSWIFCGHVEQRIDKCFKYSECHSMGEQPLRDEAIIRVVFPRMGYCDACMQHDAETRSFLVKKARQRHPEVAQRRQENKKKLDLELAKEEH